MLKCCDREFLCLVYARRDLEVARKNGLLAEVVYGYRRERKRGACPCAAAWAACFDWDI